jgi:hypothetical protein
MMKNFFVRSPLYLFLIAIFPVLSLLSANITEVSPVVAIRSALIFLLAGTLLFVFFLLFTRNLQRSAFYALLLLLVFFLIFFVLYAPVYRVLRNVHFAGTVLGRHRILVPTTFVVLLILGVLLLLFGKKFPQKILNNISMFLNFTGILLTVLPIFAIISTTIKTNRQTTLYSAQLPDVETLTVDASASLPDVYYIVLDMHTNDNVLKKLLDYDDSAFTQGLQERGFFVSQCSQSNYNSTQRSITSSLNMDYLQTLGLGSAEPKALYPVMQHSRVRRMLESLGYATYSFESGYSFVEIRDSGHYSTPTNSAINLLTYPGVTSFESLILSISAGQILYENRSELSMKVQSIIDAPYTERRAQILNAFQTLPKIPLESGPKFVYAHFLAPHDPFVFDENGDPSFRRTPFMQNADPEFGAGYGWNSYKVPYVNEVKYLDQRILEVIDQIIASSETPPIIIVQGDHGIPRVSQYNAQFQILNAYYFPGILETGLYDTISPVNSFRLMFNHYFGTDYALLEDVSYKSQDDTLTLFDQVYPCP